MKNRGMWMFGLCAAGLWGAMPLPAHADSCAAKDIRPVPDNVAVFVEQVLLGLQASLKGKTNEFVLLDLQANKPGLPKTYCAQGGQSPLAITVEGRFVGTTLTADDGRRAMGVIDLRRREYEVVDKTPVPPDIEAQLVELTKEREALNEARKDVTNRNDPRYQEVQAARYAIQLKREKALKPHEDALRARKSTIERQHSAELQRLQNEPRFSLKLTANGWDVQEPPWQLVGARGRTGLTTTRVVKVAIELSASSQPEQRQREEALANTAFDKARLQAMVDGNLPSVEDSRALIARQGEDMKSGSAQKGERDKARAAAESDERRILQAANRPAPAAAPAATAATPPPKPVNAAAPAEQAAAAPAQVAMPAPATPATPAAPAVNPASILDGVNRLRGLLGR